MQMAESPQGTGEEGLGTNQALFYVQPRDHTCSFIPDWSSLQTSP